jgi:hypothetical protein
MVGGGGQLADQMRPAQPMAGIVVAVIQGQRIVDHHTAKVRRTQGVGTLTRARPQPEQGKPLGAGHMQPPPPAADRVAVSSACKTCGPLNRDVLEDRLMCSIPG